MSSKERQFKDVLLYHLYIVNTWREVTAQLLMGLPHDVIIVNVNFDLRYLYKLPFAWVWLRIKFPNVKRIYFTSNNSSISEVLGFRKFLKWLKAYPENIRVLTYMHSKGVTRVGSKSVADWRELMRYFIIDRWDLCLEAFKNGYKLYGCNLYISPPNGGAAFDLAPYIFRGNFVNVNFPLLKDKLFSTEVAANYYGVEGYWGNLCSVNEAYCCHDSGVRHYEQEYPEHYYKQKISSFEKNK